jgi:hypothetical protein
LLEVLRIIFFMKLALQVFVDLFLLFGLLPVHVFLAPVLYILELTDEGQGICLTPPKPVFATTWEGGGRVAVQKSNLAQYLLQAHSALVQKIGKYVTQISDKIQFSKLLTSKRMSYSALVTDRNTCCIAK